MPTFGQKIPSSLNPTQKTKNIDNSVKLRVGELSPTQRRAHQLSVMCQMVSLGNTDTNTMTWTQQVIFRKTYPCTNTNVHVITTDETEVMNLTEKEERILEVGKGRGNVIKIQSQTRRVNNKFKTVLNI